MAQGTPWLPTYGVLGTSLIVVLAMNRMTEKKPNFQAMKILEHRNVYILVVVAMNRITERKLNIEAMKIWEHLNVKRASRALC